MALSRRDFLKSSAAASAAASMGMAVPSSMSAAATTATKDWRWDKAACRFCGTGCGIMMATKGEGANRKVVAVKGDPAAPVNRGLNCIKGYFNAKIMYGADRLTKPLLRVGADGKLIGLVVTILGLKNTPEMSWGLFIEKSSFLLAYFYEIFAYLSIAFLIATLVHRSGFAIGILMLYAFIIEPIISYKLPLDYGDYLPITSFGNIIQIPNSQLMKIFGIEFQTFVSITDVLIAGAWILIFHGIVFWYYKKKDF